MTARPEQLILDLPHRAALGVEDFLVSTANHAAVELIDRWPDWPSHAVVISGPSGTGKSHLVNVWRSRSGAAVVAADDVSDATVAVLVEHRALAVEDVAAGVGDERVLFHLLNTARENALTLLVTTRQPPGDLALVLPDFRSRLKALPHIALAPPDDVLLRALLVKLIADRQLQVEPAVVAALAVHMERSAAAAVRVVAEIDRRQLATRRKVTRTMALECLAAVGAGSGAADAGN